MAYNEALTDKIRTALVNMKDIVERKMFRGVAFMVNGKMFMTAGDDELMVRVDPTEHDEILDKFEGRAMIMKGREYRGFIYVNEKKLTNRNLEYLVEKASSFNASLKKAAPKKAAPKKAARTKIASGKLKSPKKQGKRS